MHQLVITICAIALSAALAVMSINYLPWWNGHAADIEKVIKNSLPILEAAYISATRATDGTPPDTTGSEDGGLRDNFGGLLKLIPAAPPHYRWVYGKHPIDGSRYSNMNYFCMKMVSNSGVLAGREEGIKRARSIFSSDQFYIGPTCGVSSNIEETENAPIMVTYYVAYAPGISP